MRPTSKGLILSAGVVRPKDLGSGPEREKTCMSPVRSTTCVCTCTHVLYAQPRWTTRTYSSLHQSVCLLDTDQAERARLRAYTVINNMRYTRPYMFEYASASTME